VREAGTLRADYGKFLEKKRKFRPTNILDGCERESGSHNPDWVDAEFRRKMQRRFLLVNVATPRGGSSTRVGTSSMPFLSVCSKAPA
jgi:hypothetical protein